MVGIVIVPDLGMFSSKRSGRESLSLVHYMSQVRQKKHG